MNKELVTAENIAKCLMLLKTARQPMTAAQIGYYLHLSGSHETQRRRVRDIVQQLRDNGNMIVANQLEGYWLTEDINLWRGYLEGRQIDAKRILAQTHKKKRQFSDAAGQELLFDNSEICGCGTMRKA